jgi:hypothetical protein
LQTIEAHLPCKKQELLKVEQIAERYQIGPFTSRVFVKTFYYLLVDNVAHSYVNDKILVQKQFLGNAMYTK